MQKPAFTLIELIFTIVIIGVLATVAVPKFANLADNAKITAELSGASTIQAKLDAIHAEWVTNRCDFAWSASYDVNTSDNEYFDDNEGYPKLLDGGSRGYETLSLVVKSLKDWEKVSGETFKYRGPASLEVSRTISNKPNQGDCWVYDPSDGSFELRENECPF
jgi:prepilin-type N-terminal cleavage/methylation domain-containing protein